MASQPIDLGAATLFNSHMYDLGNRLNTVCNYLLLVNGGILSITISAFVGATPPRLSLDGLYAIRFGWYSLTASMILALAATFIVLLGQSIVQMKMRSAFSDGSPAGLKLHSGPNWIGVAIKASVPLAFLSCVVGIACVSYGAVQLLRIPS
jgi:hypothetical protein